MKKLVGEAGLQGKGIGKRATFGFLYYTFMVRNLHKVYIHSRDINMRNVNLNSRFGFELEGVFLDDIIVGDKHQDVLRMALFKSVWLQIFPLPRNLVNDNFTIELLSLPAIRGSQSLLIQTQSVVSCRIC